MKFISINRILIAAFLIPSVAFLFSCQKGDSLKKSNTVTESDAAAYSDESAQADRF